MVKLCYNWVMLHEILFFHLDNSHQYTHQKSKHFIVNWCHFQSLTLIHLLNIFLLVLLCQHEHPLQKIKIPCLILCCWMFLGIKQTDKQLGLHVFANSNKMYLDYLYFLKRNITYFISYICNNNNKILIQMLN